MEAVFGRNESLGALGRSLDAGRVRPTVVCIRGEAGIGKTVLLESAREMAQARGYTVLACRPVGAETQLSFAALGDLLDPLIPTIDRLPGPQRAAIEIALQLRAPTDYRPDMGTIGTATLSLLTEACRENPVLVEVDDAQWLDAPSLQAVAFAARRCRYPFVLASALRGGFDSPLGRLTPPGCHEPSVVDVGPLSTLSLGDLLRERLGRVVDRATMARVVAIAGGNPLFALEIARSGPGFEPSRALHSELPRTMRARYEALPPHTRSALLLVSAAAAPTAQLLTDAGIDFPAERLLAAEREGIVRWYGNRLDFSHPMWREVIYEASEPRSRRAAHSVLTSAVVDREQRARHLALSSVRLEPGMLQALEAGADQARLRGAPSAAAELLELALERGATSAALRLQAAADHVAAGEPGTARLLASSLMNDLGSGPLRSAALHLLGEVSLHEEDFPAAVGFLLQAQADAEDDPGSCAEISIDLAFALSNLGECEQGYSWSLRAEEYAARTGDAALTAEAWAAAAVMHFLAGRGVDVERIDRALRDEGAVRNSPPYRWPSLCTAVVFLGSQNLDRAKVTLQHARDRCRDRGLESGLWLVLARQFELAMWAGDGAAAQESVQELLEWSMVAQDDALSASAIASQVALCAYRAELDDARSAYGRLLESDPRAHPIPNFVAMSALGMAENAAARIPEAVTLLEPVADFALALNIGEPMASPFFAEAIDVLAISGRREKAEALVELLERWAERSHTRWPKGAGHRGRAILLAEANQLDQAESELGEALQAFDTFGLRYDFARTELVLGGVLRRRRQRSRARECFERAHEIFLQLGATCWQQRASTELARLGLHRADGVQLTPSESRIAQLAASGLTNATVATRLSISPKTVEAHLARVYRKLGIRSRAELGRWVAAVQPRLE